MTKFKDGDYAYVDLGDITVKNEENHCFVQMADQRLEIAVEAMKAMLSHPSRSLKSIADDSFMLADMMIEKAQGGK